MRSFNEELAQLIDRREKAQVQSMKTFATTRRIIKKSMFEAERFRAVDAELRDFFRDMKPSQATEVIRRGTARGDQMPIVNGGGLIQATSNAHAPLGNGFLTELDQKTARIPSGKNVT